MTDVFRSGSVLLNSSTVPSGSTIGTANTGELCRIEFQRPKPVIVQVSCNVATRDNYITDPLDVHFFVQGVDPQLPSDSAALMFEYGVGATSRFVMLDLRAGSYALPPSTFVKVSYFAHRNGSVNPWNAPVRVSVTLFEGSYQTPTKPVYTLGVEAFNPFAGAYFPVPAGARKFDFWASGSDVFAMDATSPILVCGAPGNTFPTPVIRKNYQAGTAFPSGGPYEIQSQMDNQDYPIFIAESSGVITNFWLYTRFFLEL